MNCKEKIDEIEKILDDEHEVKIGRIREIVEDAEDKSISLEKVKKAREEIKGKVFIEEIFDEDIFNSTYTESVSKETAECESYVETEVVKMSDVLEILDKLIESEG